MTPATLAERAERLVFEAPPPSTYSRQRPTLKQQVFLATWFIPEVFFGGAGGPGKSSALLMAALQHVGVGGYAAMLLRRTYKELTLPGALLDRAHDWLDGTDAHWSEATHTFTFPAGRGESSLTLSYLQGPRDHLQYQSAEFQYIGFDELTAFEERQYTFMFSRLRGPENGPLASVPLRMRSASNPGGPGHDWVKARFGIGTPKAEQSLEQRQRLFIPALLPDNPHVNLKAYRAMLRRLDPVTRARIERGDWDVRDAGGLFRRERFKLVRREELPDGIRWVRRWDFAGTEATPGKDPDWTVGVLMGEGPEWGGLPGNIYIADVRRLRAESDEVDRLVLQTATEDGPAVAVRMEQEPGSAGKKAVAYYARRLRGLDFDGVPSSGSKLVRARPLAASASNGLVYLVENAVWNKTFLDELEIFPQEGAHDDQVDAASGAFADLTDPARTFYDA